MNKKTRPHDMNELETIKQIISSDPFLLDKVLRKITEISPKLKKDLPKKSS